MTFYVARKRAEREEFEYLGRKIKAGLVYEFGGEPDPDYFRIARIDDAYNTTHWANGLVTLGFGDNPVTPREEFQQYAEEEALAEDLHQPGVKDDKAKPLPELVLGGFAQGLAEVVAVGTFGARKYTPGGWKTVPNGEERYLEAAARHRLARQQGEVFDQESGQRHLAHEAWNILAALSLHR